MIRKFFLFDIDGTLVNTGGAGVRAMLAALKEALGDGDLVGDYSFAGKTDRDIVTTLIIDAGIERDRVGRLFETIRQSYVSRLKTTVKESPNFVVYPHVRDVLEALGNTEGCELALLTGNFRDGARIKLEHAGLWHYFGWGVFGDISEDRNNLARKAREIIVDKYGPVGPENIVVIGDTVNDIRCGRAIGATTVAYTRGFQPEETLRRENPDYLISDFNDLLPLATVP